MNSPGSYGIPPGAVFRISDAFLLAPWTDPKSGMRLSLVKPSLIHTWSNVLSWTKVPKDLLIQQIPTLEVDLSRLESLMRWPTLAVTLASGASQVASTVRFRAPARTGTVMGHCLGPLSAPQRVRPHGVTAVKNGVNLTEKIPFLQGSYSKG